MEYEYRKVDAFTGERSMGNPAAFLVVNDDSLTSEEMLKIGKEHAGFVSEIVFVENSIVADRKLTYYSSECEVDFCGHGTIATMYELIKENMELLDKKIITIDTNKKGRLIIYNEIKTEDAVYITAPDAVMLKVPVGNMQIANALGISVQDIDSKLPIDFIDAGLRTLIVPIENYALEISVYPNECVLKEFCEENDIDIILIYCSEVADASHKAHTRVFAPKFGYLEDPATGSGNSAFGNYMLKNHMWNGESISIEQGGNNIAFNTVKLRTEGGKVIFGGKATMRIAGKYYV